MPRNSTHWKGTKICSRCKKRKRYDPPEESEFHRMRTAKGDVFQAYCKECRTKHMREWRARKAEEQRCQNY